MIWVLNIGKYILAQWAIGLVIALVQGFHLVNWMNATFLVGLVIFILSGIYYLKCQNAYGGFSRSMKKFIFAIVELFTHTDHTQQRKKLNESNTAQPDLRKGSEALVASIITMAVIYLMVGLFYSV